MEILGDLLYTKEHEWIRIDGKMATMGITDYAQAALGDITFIELPTEGTEVDQFEQIASVESVKAASDIYAPMGGKIVEVNKALESSPELINQSPYGTGWIAKIELADLEEQSNLMGPDEYEKFLESLDSSESKSEDDEE